MERKLSIDWTSITQIVLYICVTIVIMFTVRSCELDETVVTKCKQACASMGNNLKEVNARSCECSGTAIQERQSIWTLGK